MKKARPAGRREYDGERSCPGISKKAGQSGSDIPETDAGCETKADVRGDVENTGYPLVAVDHLRLSCGHIDVGCDGDQRRGQQQERDRDPKMPARTPKEREEAQQGRDKEHGEPLPDQQVKIVAQLTQGL